jgi:hypothetical protein
VPLQGFIESHGKVMKQTEAARKEAKDDEKGKTSAAAAKHVTAAKAAVKPKSTPQGKAGLAGKGTKQAKELVVQQESESDDSEEASSSDGE